MAINIRHVRDEIWQDCLCLATPSEKEGGWKCHIKYKGQGCFTSFFSMQQIYACLLTVVALYACHGAITVSMFVA